MATLNNRRLRLRAVEPEDIDFMLAVENDEDIWRYGCAVAPLSRHAIMNYALSYDADPFAAGQLRLIITDATSGEAAGIADLYEISAAESRSFVGIMIVDGYRHSGIGTEALHMLSDYAARVLNLHQLAARIHTDNEPSIRLFESAGFRLAGTLRHWWRYGDTWHDMHVYQRLLGDSGFSRD